MKKSVFLLTLATAFVANSAFATEQAEDVNYGDPTALFTTLGASRAADSTMLNFQASKGNNIYQLDYGFNDAAVGSDKENKGNQNYRARMFHVTDGFGVSATVLGSHNADKTGNDAIFVGALYKFQVTENILLFPMLDIGRSYGKVLDSNNNLVDNDANIVQPGLYAMYAFDGGHWLYANPKAQYNLKEKEWVGSAEIGGGYMVTDNISIGARLDYTGESRRAKEDTKIMIQANYYF